MGKWKMVRLSDIVDKAITGEWGTECSDGKKGTKVLRTTNFTNLGVINYDNVVLRDIPLSKVDTKRLKKHDIILEKSGGSDNQPVGRVVYFDNDSTDVYLCNNFTQVLRIKQNIACPKYLFLYLFHLHQNGKTKLLQNKTTGIRNLQVKRYMALEIPLPPLPVQQQIADVLDRAGALIEKRKLQIEKLDLLIKSQFIEMFGDPVTNPKGWGKKRLGDMASVGSSKRVFVKELVDSGIPFYRGTEIGAMATGEIITPTLFISQEHYEDLRYATGVPEIGDFLMPSICPDGRIWRVNTNAPFYFKDGRVLWVHFSEKPFNDTYLLYALKEKIISDYNNIASGTTFAELKLFSLKNIYVLLPPLVLQTEFAKFAYKVETQKSLLQQSLAKLELNHKSLMQKCFKEELFNG